MPALKIIGCPGGGGLTTRPFAGDDMQLICIFMSVYRVIQVACIVPFWIRMLLFRLHGDNFVGLNGQPYWCAQDPIGTDGEISQQKISDRNENYHDMMTPFLVYLVVSLIFTLSDIIISLAAWNAASVGTPCESTERDKALRPLFWIKMTFMNCLLAVVLASGIYFVAEGRRTNYGCDDAEGVIDGVEDNAWYTMFCIVMFTYAFELLSWPCIIIVQVCKSIRYETKRSSLAWFLFNEEARHQNTAACMGGFFKCLQCISCNKLGGGKIRATSDLKDAATVFMDFFNTDTNFDIVLSDVWLAFKMLGRVHRERKYKLGKQARHDKESKRKESEMKEGAIVPYMNVPLEVEADDTFVVKDNPFAIENAEQTLYPNDDTVEEAGAGTTRKAMLRHTCSSDMHHIRQAALYSNYALGAYDVYPDALLAAGLLDGGKSGEYHPIGNCLNGSADDISLTSCFRLSDYGYPNTVIVYGTFSNDILATPYCILVDEEQKTVVVSIRGTYSLEDMVTDVQFTSVELERVGNVCGFDGKEKYAHRGMLSSCKWIYNDLAKKKLLSRLLPRGEVYNASTPCQGFNLMFTGHSLGAGVAAILSMMFRPLYPNVKCYAFEPPGCTVSLNVAVECEPYVISIVHGNDIIPRVRDANMEMLRVDFLQVLARVKVPKVKAWRESRVPCRNKDVEARNKLLLHPKDQIPETDYSIALNAFIEKREIAFDVMSPPEARLNIPGRIIHLVHAMGRGGNYSEKCLPYWESRKSLLEIELSIEVLKEHSMDIVVPILNNIATDYENASKGISDEDDDVSVESDNQSYYGGEYEYDMSADDRWFVLCSRPHGSVSLIPPILSIAACCCSTIGHNLCDLFFRQVGEGEVYYSSRLTEGDDVEVAGVSLGLYTYGVKYGDEDDYELQCGALPADVTIDAYIKTARSFAILSNVVGISVAFVLTLSICMKLSQKFFRRIAIASFFVSWFQSMIFIYLRSEKCYQDDLFPIYGFDLESCSLDTGSKMSIAAAVLWFASAVFLGWMDTARITEARLKLISRHVIESYR